MIYLYLHVDKNCSHQISTAGSFKSMNSIQTKLNGYDDVIIARLCGLGRTL